jgi:replicative DNA helicase
LAHFEKIILSVDNDAPGDALAEKIYRMFPGKTYRVLHGKYKDANDYLQNGAGPQYKDAWWNAQKIKPDGFVSSPEQWEEILRTETPYEYVPTPIDALNKKIRGFVKGGITVVKALPGTGKTSVFRFFQHYLLKHSDAKFAVLHMEEMKATTGRGLVTYELGVNVNTKEDAETNNVSEETVIDTLKSLVSGDRFVTFDIDPNNPVESILESIRVAREVYGVDYIFLDHLQRIVYLAGVDNATTALTELAVKVVDMTRKDSWGLIAISHVNSDGATKYAKAVEEEAIVVLQLERDKDAADPEERDTTYITVTKNRPFAALGDGGKLKYDADTTTVEEKVIHEPKTPRHTDDTPF